MSRLVVIEDIVKELESKGRRMTSNAVRARLKDAMFGIACEACSAVGTDMSADEIERIANSRAFQEAVATIVSGEDA